MGDSLVQLVRLDSNSEDYKDVEQKMTSTGLRLNILTVSAAAFTFILQWEKRQQHSEHLEKGGVEGGFLSDHPEVPAAGVVPGAGLQGWERME